MELLERRIQVAELEAALADARTGHGNVVLVTGAAGAGKTSLVRHFQSAVAGHTRVVWGMCDELLTPRPLGPIREIAEQLGSNLGVGVTVSEMLDGLVSALRRGPQPVMILIEDVHWADEATIDAIRFLGRRVGQMSTMLVLTYRDDQVPADHLWRRAIGAIPPSDTHRVELSSLSRDAVAELAGQDDIDDLYRLTGGNPFYVTEVLASPDVTVPATVQDAIIARLGRLSDRGRACVEAAAVVPGRVERWLLVECDAAGGLADATDAGMLQPDGETMCFSHELARRAVEESLPPARRQEINRSVLNVLAGAEADLARLVHHAVQAGDAAAVVRYAPIAARQAVVLDSHQEAAAHYRHALGHADSYSPANRAELWYEYARECWHIESHDEAQRAVRNAIELHTELQDQLALGSDFTLLSDVAWNLRDGAEVARASTRAIDVLSQLPPSVALAGAYAQRAKVALVDLRASEAVEWGEKAIRLARELGDTAVLVHALNTVGTARWHNPPFDNSALLESLDLAQAKGETAQAGRSYANLVAGFVEGRQYDLAEQYLDKGLAFCEAHDLLTSYRMLLSHRSAWHQALAQWDKAEADAKKVLAEGAGRHISALHNLLQSYVRRGSDEAVATLREAQRLADRSGDAQDVVPIGLTQIELAWLNGAAADQVEFADEMLTLAQRTKVPHWIGQAALWLKRAGGPVTVPQGAEEPYVLQITGKWREAAAAWDQIGVPYEKADALADAPETGPMLEALEILTWLGAKPRAAMVRHRLAELGVTSVPRGPRESTRANVAGLTARQLDVLALLAEHLSYQEIAGRLHVSVKTVDHHSAAIRMKLNATTSAEAVAEARRLGILPGPGPSHDLS